MTLLENRTVSPAVAARFPIIQALTSASGLERALERTVTGHEPSIGDILLELNKVDRASLHRCRAWADEASGRCAGRLDPSVPAGRATDRAVRPGTWLGLPAAGGGFAASLVVRRKAGVVIFGDAMLYVFPKIFDFYPTIDHVRDLRPEDGCALVGTSLIDVRDGRWRVIGEQPSFDPIAWIIPAEWWQSVPQMKRGVVSYTPEGRPPREIAVPDSLLSLDRSGTQIRRGMSPPDWIEDYAGIFGRRPALARSAWWAKEHGITPGRLRRWRKMNRELDRRYDRH